MEVDAMRNRTPIAAAASIASALTLMMCSCAHARDGMLDATFGTGGKMQTAYDIAFTPLYVSPSILGGAGIQSSGKLVFASAVAPSGSTNSNFGVTRLNTDGSVDFSFGLLGSTVVAFDRMSSSLADYVGDMVVLPDDSILITGFVAGDSTTGFDFGVVKLTAEGQPDTSFAGSGKAIVQFNTSATYNNDVAAGIGVQTDGKILLVGTAETGPPTPSGQSASVVAITRLTANGVRDTTFNATGRVTFGYGGDVAVAYRVHELMDGQHLLVAGYATTVVGATRYRFALARLNIADGSLDTTFGTAGKATFDFPFAGGNAGATDFVELPDGRLMVCGPVLVNFPDNGDPACMRFLANGAPDPSYQPFDIPFDLGGDLNDQTIRMNRDTQGRLLLAGFAAVGPQNADCAVARLTPAGALDSTFGIAGRITFDSRLTTSGSDRDNGCFGLVIQPDGKIVAAGFAAINDNTPSPDYDLQVVRFIGDTIFSDGFQ